MKCKGCNAEINPYISICPYCGTDNSTDTNNGQFRPGPVDIRPPEPAPKKKNKTLIISIIVAAVFLIAVTVVSVLIVRGRSQKDDTSSSSDQAVEEQTKEDAVVPALTTESKAAGTDTTDSKTVGADSTETPAVTGTSGSGETVYDHVKGKTAKNGFDLSTNKTEIIYTHSYSMPEYMGDQMKQQNSYTYYPEMNSSGTDISVVCLTINEKSYPSVALYKDEEIISEFQESTKSTLESMATDAKILSTEKVQINGMIGLRIDATYTLAAIPVLSRIYALVDKENQTALVLFFQQSESSKYTYFEDFDQIVFNIQRADDTKNPDADTEQSSTVASGSAGQTGGVEYEFDGGKKHVTFPETYDVYQKDAEDFDDELVKRSGLSEEKLRQYLEALDFNDIIAVPREHQLLEDDRKIYVKVKSDGYEGGDFRKCSEADRKTLADALVGSFGISDYQWLNTGKYDFVCFDVTMNNHQRRYATLVNGSLVYIYMSTEQPITDEEIKIVEEVVRSFNAD